MCGGVGDRTAHVVRVAPHGAAAAAGVTRGMRLRAVAGITVERRGDVDDAVAATGLVDLPRLNGEKGKVEERWMLLPRNA
eukprot:gene3280-26253_t